MSTALTTRLEQPALTQADTDHQLIALWLHGRPTTTQAAYRGDVTRFLTFAGKPLETVEKVIFGLNGGSSSDSSWHR